MRTSAGPGWRVRLPPARLPPALPPALRALRTDGLGCAAVLKLTRGRGARFCTILNEVVIEAVTTACRTYVNTITGLQLLHADVRLTLDYGMMTGLMVDSMHRATGQCEWYEGPLGHQLFSSNFVLWSDGAHAVPRHALPACMLAFAMRGHARLGGADRPWADLGDDVLRAVWALLREGQR